MRGSKNLVISIISSEFNISLEYSAAEKTDLSNISKILLKTLPS